MSNLDLLPAAQLASLRLIVTGRSYSEVADALAIEVDSVADNARLAVSSLAGPAADSLALAERGRVADWLLGQSEHEPLVEGSPAARAFAQAASDELAAIDGAVLPLLPEAELPPTTPSGQPLRPAKEFAPATGRVEKPAAGPSTPATDRTKATEPVGTGSSQPEADAADGEGRGTPEISRKGGIAVLAAAGVAVLIGGLAIGGVFDGGDESTPTTAPTTAASTPSTAQTTPGAGAGTPDGKGGWTLRKRFTLKPVAGGKALGVAGLESKGSQNAMLVAGTGFKPNTTVGIWLTGGPEPALVGFQKVNAKGEFTAVAAVPRTAPQASRVVVTTESVQPGQPVPKSPGTVVLASPFSV